MADEEHQQQVVRRELAAERGERAPDLFRRCGVGGVATFEERGDPRVVETELLEKRGDRRLAPLRVLLRVSRLAMRPGAKRRQPGATPSPATLDGQADRRCTVMADRQATSTRSPEARAGAEMDINGAAQAHRWPLPGRRRVHLHGRNRDTNTSTPDE